MPTRRGGGDRWVEKTRQKSGWHVCCHAASRITIPSSNRFGLGATTVLFVIEVGIEADYSSSLRTYSKVMDLSETTPSSPATQAASFKYPPLYSFPPFFTLQPNANTLATQLSQWSNFITAWCRFNRVFLLDANATSGKELAALWGNSDIDRRLDEQSRRKVLESMVNEGKASWEPPLPTKPKAGTPTPTRALIYWRRPEEWGDRIHQWVSTSFSIRIMWRAKHFHIDVMSGVEHWTKRLYHDLFRVDRGRCHSRPRWVMRYVCLAD